MVNPHSSYPFIREKLEEYCLKLMEFPECSYWIHEKVVADFIGIGRSDEFGQSKLLTSLLVCVKNGHGGKRRNKNSFKLTGVNMVDLNDENNGSRVCCQEFGLREEFQGGILATEGDFRIPRWFKFGNQCQPKVCTQLIVANELIGNCNVSSLSAADPGVIPKFALKRRRQSYANFSRANSGNVSPTGTTTSLSSSRTASTCGRTSRPPCLMILKRGNRGDGPSPRSTLIGSRKIYAYCS